MKKTHYTYKITDPVNDEYYIGVRSCEGKLENDSYMGSYCAWEPKDESRLEKEILGTYPTRLLANSVERKLQILALKVHRDPKCMNAYIANIGYCTYGKTHTEESKRKISEVQKGVKRSKETCRKISEGHKGKKLSKEHKEKLSIAKSGKNHYNYDKKLSEETKLKMSKSHKGKKHSEERKRKMSKAKMGIPRHCSRKRLLQLDTDGNIIKKWNTLTEAATELNIFQGNITYVCQGKRKTAGGFVWKYDQH